jgi:large subunit ribosomal protein L31
VKEGIHPAYREVCFVDLSNGFKFVTRSCAQTRETIKMDDGRELPLVKLETTSESHPFYTGTQKSIDNLGGRVEKFRNKFARVGLKKSAASAPERRQPRLPFCFGSGRRLAPSLRLREASLSARCAAVRHD